LQQLGEAKKKHLATLDAVVNTLDPWYFSMVHGFFMDF
jgi:hypothetical protein